MTTQEATTGTSTTQGQAPPQASTQSQSQPQSEAQLRPQYHRQHEHEQDQAQPQPQTQTHQPRTDYPFHTMPQKRILLINGPNLNLLGHREPTIYGSTTLSSLTTTLTTYALDNNIALDTFQSNHEGLLIDRIHACLLGHTIPQSITTTSALPTPFSSSPLSPDSYQPDMSSITTTAGAGRLSSSNQHTLSSTENRETTRVAKPDAIIINPGAFTHTSVALRDALLGVGVPYIEVHISNVHAREAFRHHSYLSDKAEAVICGLGTYGYEAALGYFVRKWT